MTSMRSTQYQAVVISDVGALTLLVTPDARAGRVGVNRLDVLKAYVESGGGLMLAGGYMGFQGMFGTARFHDTAVEDVLPVRCLPYCDGMEVPQGLQAAIVQPVPSDICRNRGALAADPRHEQAGLQERRFVPASRDLPPSRHGLAASCRSQPWPRPHGRLGDRHRPALALAGFSRMALYGKLMANIVRWLAGNE